MSKDLQIRSNRKMLISLAFALLILAPTYLFAQKTTVTVQGVEFTIGSNDTLYIMGNLLVKKEIGGSYTDGKIFNSGTIIITDSIKNFTKELFIGSSNPFVAESNPPLKLPSMGQLYFSGNTKQVVAGFSKSILFNDFFINNVNGVEFDSTMIALGQVNFTNGNLHLNGNDLLLYYDLKGYSRYSGNLGSESGYRVVDYTRRNDTRIGERTGHVLALIDAIPAFNDYKIGLNTSDVTLEDTLLIERGHTNLPYAANGSINKYFMLMSEETSTPQYNISYIDNDYLAGLNESNFRIFKRVNKSVVNYREVQNSSTKIAENITTGMVDINKDSTHVITIADNICDDPPRAILSPTMDVCVGSPFEIKIDRIEQSGNLEVDYRWEKGGNAIPSTQNSISDVHYTAASSVYTVTVIDTRGCLSSNSITVNSHNTPIARIGLKGKSPFCYGKILNLKDSTILDDRTDYNLQWSLGDGFIDNSSEFEYTYSSVGSYNVQLIASNRYCSDTASRVIVIKSLPIVDFSIESMCGLSAKTIRVQNTTVFNDIDPFNVVSSSIWEFEENGNIVKSDSAVSPDNFLPITNTFSNVGAKKVSLAVTSSYGCVDTKSKDITVDNQVVDFEFASNLCQGSSIQFTNKSTTTSSKIPIYTWVFGDGTTVNEPEPKKTYNSPGTYNVVLRMNNGLCIDTIKKEVVIHPKPNLTFSTGTVCQGSSLTLIPSVTVHSSYRWNIQGDIINEVLPTYVFNNSGNINIALTVTSEFGCTSLIQKQVTVNQKPIANFAIKSDCLGKATQFYNQSTVSGGSLSYQWRFTSIDNSVQTNPQFVYLNSNGSEHARLIATSNNNCSDTIDKPVEIYQLPDITLSDIDYCGTSYSLNATVTNVTGSTYVWDDGIKTAIRIANQSKNYTVKVTSGKGCESEKTIKLTLGVDINPDLPESISFCGRGNLNAKYNNDMCTWFRPDGSMIANSREIVADQSGWYKVLVADSQCSKRDSSFVTINQLPQVNLGDDLFECSGSSVLLDAGAGFVSYLWSTGQTTQTINVSNEDNYSVIVKDNYGCANTDNVKVNLRALPSEPFVVSELSECNTVQLYAGGTGLSYLWNDGSTSNTLNVNTSGDYSVKISNRYCSVVDNIRVNILQVDRVNLGSDISICEGSPVVLNAGSHDSNYSYLWNMQSSISNQYSVNKTGRYTCEIKNKDNGCTSSDDIFVLFNPSPRVDLGMDKSLCGASSLTLDAGNPGATIQWGSGKAFTSIQQVNSITEPDKYWVMVMNSNGCIASDTITIYPTASNIFAQFIAASKIFQGDTVVFKNMSYGSAYTSSWLFGDGVMSIEEHPQHVYRYPNTFNVTLTVTNGYCFSKMTKPITVIEDNRKIGSNGKRIGDKYLEIVSSKLYPNPTNGNIYFEMELSDFADVVIGVYSLRGDLVLTDKVKNGLLISKQYLLNSLTPGVYILKAWVRDKSVSYKIIKTR